MSPTITSFTPTRGHTGGRTFLEIVGAGFRQQTLDLSVTTAPPASVQVMFGTTVCQHVDVLSAELIACKTPKLDSFREQQTFTVDAGTDIITAADHGMLSGEVVTLTSTAVLPGGLTVSPDPFWVVNPTGSSFQLATDPGGAPIDITDTGSGTHTVESDGRVAITVSNLEYQHGAVVSQAGPFALSDGETITLEVDGGASQTVTFNTASFASIGAATALEIAAVVIAQGVGLRSTAEAGSLTVITDTAGPDGQVSITGGTAAISFVSTVGVGSLTLVPVPGETVVMPKAFAPVRPDLSAESHLATVVGQLILELRRQLVENVAWTTNTDYDADTGDQLNIANVASLPALILAGLSTPENRDHGSPVQTVEVPLNDATGPDGDFAELKPPVIVDLVGALVGVTDDDKQLLNLLQATRVFFRDNGTLEVPRCYGDPSLGVVEYQMEASINTQVSITASGSNTNVQFFAFDFRVEGIQIEKMAGLPTEGIARAAAYAPSRIIGVGKTAETINTTVEPL